MQLKLMVPVHPCCVQSKQKLADMNCTNLTLVDWHQETDVALSSGMETDEMHLRAVRLCLCLQATVQMLTKLMPKQKDETEMTRVEKTSKNVEQHRVSCEKCAFGLCVLLDQNEEEKS